MIECVKCHTPLPADSKFCLACGYDVSGGDAAPTATSAEALLQRMQRLVEGKYRVERILGKGGMGAVFLAHDLTLEREVAIKVLPPDIAQDEHVMRRFQQEAKTAAKLDHPNIIPIYRVESEGGLNYFVMKYIAGTSLEDVLEQKRPLSTEYIQRVLWEAACALGHAHQRGVVHRDVKPANIMFDHDGRVMLTDFGISKALQAASGFTATGMIIGTPHYMAPEQAKGQTVDGRADQYSLGVVGYRMITGELPFSGDSVHTILYKHIFEEPPRASARRADVPEFLSVAISRALSKEPDQRYGTMEEFATAVWPEQPVAAPTKGKAATRPQPRPRPVGPDAPTEFTSAPTTPLPAARASAKAAPKRVRKPSRTGLLVGLTVVALGGVGGYLVLGRGTRTETKPAPGSVPAPVDTVRIADTVRVPAPAIDSSRVAKSALAQPARQPSRREPARQPALTPAQPAAEAQGFITVNSDPFGEVYIDGADVGPAPVVEYAVKPGRHTIRVERAGYKAINETVQVEANNTVRKRYTLFQEGP